MKKKTIEQAQQEQPKEEKGKITNPKDLAQRLLDALLAQKTKMISVAEVSSYVTGAFIDFEEHALNDEQSPLNANKLKDVSPEAVFRITTLSCLTRVLAEILSKVAPEVADEIQKLLP